MSCDDPHCHEVIAGLAHCHEPSIEHADGTTECYDPDCDLPHYLHDWHLSCSVFDPPCNCVPDEPPIPLLEQLPVAA